MHIKIKNRFKILIITIASISLGVMLLLNAMSDSITFFYSPSEIPNPLPKKDFRIGGMVKAGSVINRSGVSVIEFIITDFKNEIPVLYQGILPSLFREGQGVVAKGSIENNIFIAKEVLAKHDENYMPPMHNQ
jgi:cytochrome c-type biogenesis protein CcmE